MTEQLQTNYLTTEVIATMQVVRFPKRRKKKLAHLNSEGKEVCEALRWKLSNKLGFKVFCSSTIINPRNGRCEVHGGGTPVGSAQGENKLTAGGRYSMDLPTRMLPDYDFHRNAPDILNLRDEAALVRSNINDQLRKMKEGESLEAWKLVRKLVKDYRQALKDSIDSSLPIEDSAMATAHAEALLDQLEQVTQYGLGEWINRKGIERSVLVVERVVRSERKAGVELGQLVLMHQVELLILALTDAVRRNVTNPLELEAINREFNRLTSGVGEPAVDAAGTQA